VKRRKEINVQNASSFSYHKKIHKHKKVARRERKKKEKVCHGNWKLFNHEERRYFYGIIRDIKGESILKCNKRKEEKKIDKNCYRHRRREGGLR
jgi:hypothetical protein